MGAVTTDFSTIFQTYYLPDALKKAERDSILMQFGKKAQLPQGKWSTQVDWIQPNDPTSGDVVTLTQGSQYAVASGTVTVAKVSGSMILYGCSTTISNILDATSGIDFMDHAEGHIKKSIEYKVDDLVRNEVATGTATVDRYPTALGTNTFAGLNTATGASTTIKMQDILYATTNLRINNADPHGNKGFVAAASPAVMADVLSDNAFINITAYGASERTFNAEAGKIAGATLVWHNNAFIEGTVENTYSSTGAIYSTMIFGRDSFGVVDMSMFNMRPTVSILADADKFDIYNMNFTAAAKFYFTTKVLRGNWIVNLRSKVNYS